MPEEEYSVKTVAQLKLILQEKGLPVSGKKADLIARLVESENSSNPKPVVIGDSVQEGEKSSAEDLPYLSNIIRNGINSVELNKQQAINYGIIVFMFTIIVIGLNSTSWYNLEASGTSNNPFGTDYSYDLSLIHI